MASRTRLHSKKTFRHFLMQSVIISAVSASVYAAEKYNANENKTKPGDPNDPFANFRTTGIGRETMHTTIYGSYENERDAFNHNSPYSMSLNGKWKFKLYQRPSEVPETFMANDFDDSEWGSIAVPSNWQLDPNVDDQPYYTRDSYIFDANPPELPEWNPTGCYRQTFNLPDGWINRDVRLTFGGVDSAFRLWVNGKDVGYSEDSRLPAEFAISEYLVKGQNTIAVEVQRFSTGSYLESQDVWHMSGIYRDVRIMARPKVHLRDWSIRTTFDNTYTDATLDATVYLETRALPSVTVSGPGEFPGYRVRLRLADRNDRIVAESELKSFSAGSGMYGQNTERGGAKFSLKVARPLKWTPEHPNLYRLYIYLTNENGTVREVQCQNVGFRQIEIKDKQVLVNGKRLIVRGVNRHDFSAYHGFAVTEQEMRADIELMKKLNFNAVRTCHYPDNERWYELCDELGLFVVDETNIETQGIQAWPTLMQEWSAVYLERAQRMLLRDRNHPCIILWSLGNESGAGASHAAMAAWLRHTDPSRFVQYESGNPPASISDILCPMYARAGQLAGRARRDSRPIILCEYAYAKGNATGDFFKYWDVFRSEPSVQGGFIWDWSDKALFGTCIADGKKHLGYANDLGENFDYQSALGGQHPEQVLNGIVAADLQPHPGAEEVRIYQAPVSFKLQDLKTEGESCTIRLTVNNEYLDTNLDTLTCKWDVTGNGLIGEKGEMKLPSVEAMQAGEIQLAGKYNKNEESFFNLYVYDGEREITRAQFKITGDDISATPGRNIEPDAGIKVTEDADFLTAGAFKWSKKTGQLVSVKVNRIEQLAGPVEQLFWRAPTCNDRILDARNAYFRDWEQLFHAKEQLIGFSWEKDAEGFIVVTVKSRVHVIETTVVWKVGENDRIEFEQTATFSQAQLHSVARVGMLFPLAKDADSWGRYYGRGPHENYPDRQQTALIGNYEAKVADMMEHSYLIPQECGSRGDVRQLFLTDKDVKLTVTQANNTPFRFSALPYSPTVLKDTKHDWELPATDGKTWLILDGFHMGVGGDDGWSTNVHNEFLLRPKTYKWGAILDFAFLYR